jgi:DNA polymerase-3 subunit delta
MAKPSARQQPAPPVIVIFGDDSYARQEELTSALNQLLPEGVDRSMACMDYDASIPDTAPPDFATIADDLNTPPFLAPRRVVVIRDADGFITTYRSSLEAYLNRPSPTGTLMLTCRSFPKTTKLYKAAEACGEIVECKKLKSKALEDSAFRHATQLGKRLLPTAGANLLELISQDQGVLRNELEKLALYVGDRETVTEQDVADLVGQSREQLIFNVMDAAGGGDAAAALELWRQTIAGDSAAVFKAAAGIAFTLRKWITAHQMRSDGMSVSAIAPKVLMWGRESLLERILRVVPLSMVREELAQLARLDAQAKSGLRSIETGVEAMLLRIAAGAQPAAAARSR